MPQVSGISGFFKTFMWPVEISRSYILRREILGLITVTSQFLAGLFQFKSKPAFWDSIMLSECADKYVSPNDRCAMVSSEVRRILHAAASVVCICHLKKRRRIIRSGVVCPKAVFKPVRTSLKTVSLHNMHRRPSKKEHDFVDFSTMTSKK